MIFETVAQLKLATLTAGQLVSTKGYYASGDGGAANYLVAATQAVDGYGDHTLAGGTVALLQSSGSVSAQQFGAKGDGVTDNTAVIRNLVSRSGEVYFPSGIYMTDYIVFGATGLKFKGESRASTTFKLNSGQNNHVFNFVNAIDCEFESLTIHQDHTNNPNGGHGLRLAGTTNLILRDLLIKESHSYGIGIQAGSNINTLLTNFEINDCGRDGIDIKDYNSENSLTISDGYITGHGRDVTVLQQAGLDVRGHAVVNNIHIIATNDNETRGLRLRQGGNQGRAGSGTFSNIYYRSIGFTNGGNVGLDIGSSAVIAEQVKTFSISNITIDGGGVGALLNGGGGVISGFTILNSGVDAISYGGSDLTINGLYIDSPANRAIDVEVAGDRLIVNGFNMTNAGSVDCVRIQSGPEDCAFTNGSIDVGSRIGDNGSGTVIENVRNYKTSANLLSADLAVDSIGVVSFAITHGLGTGITPNFEDVSLSVVSSTGDPLDYELGFVQLISVSSSNIVGKVSVVAASLTSGAAIKIAALVRTKGS